MLEYNRNVKKKLHNLSRLALLILPAVCIVMLLSQTAFAKSTYLINDGGKVLIHTTYATDPADVLTEAGLTLGEDDTYTTEAGQMMQEIIIQRKQTITILQGSKRLEAVSYGETVESLISRMGLILTKADILSVSMDTMTSDGMVIVISRTHLIQQTYSVVIPYETVYCCDPSVPEGEQVILTEGVDGQLLRTEAVSYVDGNEISRQLVSEQVLHQKVDRVIAIGTYTPEQEQSPMPQEPARPEVTGKLVISDGTIITPDGEVLTYKGSLNVIGTAYHNTDPGCTIYTAIGTLCRVGAIAVDPKVIPLGTRMYIVSDDGKYIYGIAVAEDTGSAIKGNRIDLYFDSVDECNTFGIRPCTVYFLG